jgi:SAM-dependent methyltransferase
MRLSNAAQPESAAHSAAHRDSSPTSRALEPCPICGEGSAREWLKGSDRFHGRNQKYTLLRCPGCSLVWLSQPPTPAEMYRHYTDAYLKLISAAGENSRGRWHDRVRTLRRYQQSGTILDLGCSSGGFLAFFRGDSWKLYGVEMSADCAKRAELSTGAHVFVGDIGDAPFVSEFFDVITCFDVLEHLYEPLQIMSKVREWLKPGGIFYVQVPNIDSAEARVFQTYWHGLELPRHLFHYSPASLKFLAESVGLRQVSLEAKRNPAVGTSLRYVWDDVFGLAGIKRTAVAYRGEASLPWRAARKFVRMTVLRGLLSLAPIAGDGEAIHAIFCKERVSA